MSHPQAAGDVPTAAAPDRCPFAYYNVLLCLNWYSELAIRSTFEPIAYSFYCEAQRREIYASWLYLAQRERISCCSTAVTGRRWGGGIGNERAVVLG
jgi:hypothetical protein